MLALVDCQEEKLSLTAISIKSFEKGPGHELLHGQDALAWGFYIFHVVERRGRECDQWLKIGSL
jgi:hypothetical protein